MGTPGKSDSDRTLYISSDGRVHTNPSEAISASLGHEDVSGTGAGCNQSPENVSSDSGDGDDE